MVIFLGLSWKKEKYFWGKSWIGNWHSARQTKTYCARLCLYPQEYNILTAILDLIQISFVIQFLGIFHNLMIWWHCSDDHVLELWIAITNPPYVQFNPPADWKYKVEEVWVSPDLGSFFLCFGILRPFWIVEYCYSTDKFDWIVISQHCISLEICYCAQFLPHSSPVSLISSSLFAEDTFTFSSAADTSRLI